MTHQLLAAPGLSRRRHGAAALTAFAMAAAAPITAVGGTAVVATVVTGNRGVPIAFLGLGAALALFAVGYSAMTRYVENPVAFSGYLTQGISRIAGIGGWAVGVVAYNGLLLGLYGLFGAAASSFAARHWSLTWSWWVWALIAVVVIGAFGLGHLDLPARVLLGFLALELVTIVALIVAGCLRPAGFNAAGLHAGDLFSAGLGGVIALGVSAFAGLESGAAYAAEAKEPRRTIPRAAYLAIAVTALLYAAGSWALAEWGAVDPFGPIGVAFGNAPATLAAAVLPLGTLAALLSFHMTLTRTLFAGGTDGLLPSAYATVNRRTGAPVAATLTQSAIALVGVLVAALGGTDPLRELFAWGSYVAGVGLLAVMVGVSLAVILFFRGRDTAENTWQRLVAPALSALVLTVLLVVVLVEPGFPG
jgi:amino acid transporter